MLTPIDYLNQLVGYQPAKRQQPEAEWAHRYPEFPAGGAVYANPGLLPPGAVVYEDGSWHVPGNEVAPYPQGLFPGRNPEVPWEGDGVAGMLPGVFGGGNGGFEPSGPPIPITGPMPPPPEGPLNPPQIKSIAFG